MSESPSTSAPPTYTPSNLATKSKEAFTKKLATPY